MYKSEYIKKAGLYIKERIKIIDLNFYLMKLKKKGKLNPK